MNVSVTAAAVLLAAIALAGCRGDDPDQAPPIGRADVAASTAVLPAAESVPAAQGTVHTATAVAAPGMRADDPAERAHRYRDAAEAARAALDTAWNRCGALADADARRCRDAAVLDYDAAIGEARALRGDDADPAAVAEPVPGVLQRTTDLAMLQVTGTRG